MKLTIEIDDNLYLESYLSIVSLGVLSCLQKNIINCDDAMNLVYFPGMIEKLKELFPNLGNAYIMTVTQSVNIKKQGILLHKVS